MKVLCILAVLCACYQSTQAVAGRAFPVAAENYVVEQFQTVNRAIEWDPSNFLVDLSGNYASCQFANSRGFVDVDEETPEGGSIGGIQDFTYGEETHVGAVEQYVTDVIDSWMNNYAYLDQIKRAQYFGCSVRPGCRGKVSVACLFSPGHGSGNIIQPTEPPKEQPEVGNQKGLAFTKEQYDMAEQITGRIWDRSHFLENLSGYETRCAMIGKSFWSFTSAEAEASKRGMRIIGLYGYTPNHGDTTEALAVVLSSFKKIPAAIEVGCSTIPDCYSGRGDMRQMYVVVSCVYEEEF